LTRQTEAVGDWKLNIVDARERGECVVVRIELTVHGTSSGLDVPGDLMQVVEVANAKVQRVRGVLLVGGGPPSRRSWLVTNRLSVSRGMKSQAITEVRRLLETRQRELKAELREIEAALRVGSPPPTWAYAWSQAQARGCSGPRTRLI
jgi:hypothetical protein